MAGLKRFELSPGVVYGPVLSRRLGLSLGINLLPPGIKVCSFNCAYCQCGWSRMPYDCADAGWPSPQQVRGELERTLQDLALKGIKLDAITFSGNGEPTLHPQFSECVRAVLDVRDRRLNGVRVAVLSNGAHLDRQDVVAGMNLVDDRYIKMDAGFDRLDKPRRRVSLDQIAAWTGRLRNFVAQSMFVQGAIDNTGPRAVESWISLLLKAKPVGVHLYSLGRIPANKNLRRVPQQNLQAIANLVRARTGIPAIVY